LRRETEYGNGLPFEFTGIYDQTLAEYGHQIYPFANPGKPYKLQRRTNQPNPAVGVSAGADPYK